MHATARLLTPLLHRQVFTRRKEVASAEAARGIGADDTRVTGALVWDASVVLASYLSATLGAVTQQRTGEPAMQLPAEATCIELGCGLGLAGLAAAALGMDVTLTDRHEVVPLIKASVAANDVTDSVVTTVTTVQGRLQPLQASVAANDVGRTVGVVPLSWGDDEAARALRPGGRAFDAVLMADVICARPEEFDTRPTHHARCRHAYANRCFAERPCATIRPSRLPRPRACLSD